MKTAAGDNTNRISALKRLSNPTANTNVHRRLSAPTAPVVTDARQLLTNRKKPIFDARQLLSRQSSNTSLIQRNNTVEIEIEEQNEPKAMFITRSKDGRLTSGNANRNSHLTEPISFTKTITNTSLQRKDVDSYSQPSNTQSSSSDQKVVISFVNDQYRKRPKSPSPPPPPPVVRRLHDASIQTAHAASSSRSPLRTATSRRKYSDDHYEPPTKRTASRNTLSDREQHGSSLTAKSSLKRTSTEASTGTRSKPSSSSTSRSTSDVTAVLITNLQSSVTEDDIIELFSGVGDINDIQTLSRGCIQISYSNPEQAEDAVAKYHNRLLDGKLIYVSLQQAPSYATKASKTSSTQHSKASSSNNNNESSQSNANKITIDPAFIRQALFNPSSSTTNTVQFQVKL